MLRQASTLIRPRHRAAACCWAQRAAASTLVYEGSLASTLKTIKMVSVTSCAVGMVGMPALMMLNDTVPLAGRAAITGTAMVAAVGSTALLNYCTKPYVCELWRVDGDDGADDDGAAGAAAAAAAAAGDDDGGAFDDDPLFEAKTLTLLAQVRTRRFRGSEIEPIPKAMHPFTNFGAGEHAFYIQKEALEDDEVYALLTAEPRPASGDDDADPPPR